MRVDEIRQLIKLLEENAGIVEIEMSSFLGGHRVRVSRRGETAAPAVAPAAPAPVSAGGAAAAPAPQADGDLHVIKAPMVGTFYTAPNPDADPFVSEGSKVTPGTVLCIVEAMKLMNEIESDVSGVVREILVENGQAVEFGQPLFRVERR
ncbi:MAG: acetyl-CoA carboxylase biotin carboxyl carrier protein [Candidatus Krumholzibacteriia bacterium]|nr:acetyl-CoA carboxylase biotin carboxyl carrier protein [bacterium]MCB9515022.1 acetyl-CoA carboxylase biotin carboxyl carrier protein [Candidatus Latescibacterota bacterium]